MTHRVEKVESTLQREIAEVLQKHISDPRIAEGMVSITRVKVSPDLREAAVYVSILPEGKQKLVTSGLQHAAARIRRLVGKSVQMRTLPQLTFRLDESLKTQARVHGAIHQAMNRTGPPPEAPPEEPPEDEPSEKHDDTP